MDIYRRHFKRTVFWWKTQLWVEKKIMRPPPYYYFFNMFAPTKARGSGMMNIKKHSDDWHLFTKFFKKYPESHFAPSYMTLEPEMYSNVPTHPAARFVTRQKYFISEGYTEAKAFELAEKEMAESLQEEKYERSLIEGLATSNRARSLLSIYEQQAEFEARQKIDRLNREIPDYLRTQIEYDRETADIIDNTDTKQEQDKNKLYEPVSYMIARSKDEKDDAFKNHKKLQEEFVLRAEKLMEFYNSFAYIRDGISRLNEKDIVLQANQSPKKLKDHMRKFLKKIDKMNVKLNEKGEVDYTNIHDKIILNFVKKNEHQIKVCLYYRDLEFEFPHKVYVSELKANILSEIQKEERKFEEFEETQEKERRLREEEEERRRVMTYERYFNLPLNCNADKVNSNFDDRNKNLSIKKAYTFEEWAKMRSSENLFDQDLLKEQYNYFEGPAEKEERLRKLWIDAKTSRVQSSIGKITIFNIKDLPSNEETTKLNNEIVGHIRKLRKRIDQDLLNSYQHPVFGSNYRQYDISEFMLDSEIEFEKIKRFLNNNPNIIKEDNEVKEDYLKLITKLKRKKIIERTIAPYGEEHLNDYHDIGEIDHNRAEIAEEEKMETFASVGSDVLMDVVVSEMKKETVNELEAARVSRSRVQIVDEEALEKKKIESIKERILTNFKSVLMKNEKGLNLDQSGKKKADKKGKGKAETDSKKEPAVAKKNKN